MTGPFIQDQLVSSVPPGLDLELSGDRSALCGALPQMQPLSGNMPLFGKCAFANWSKNALTNPLGEKKAV